MRAIVVKQPGDVSQLELTRIPEPVAGPGEVLIDVRYASCNWMDTEKRRGVYPDKSLTYPMILGNEVCGTIRKCGGGVKGLTEGQRVAAILPSGGYAELCVAHPDLIIPLPEAIPDTLGAAFPIVSLTAYHLLNSAYSLKEGETLLIHAIGGGVGLMTTQMAAQMGARVIGTVSSDGKGEQALAFGAACVVNRSKEDFVKAALDFTDGRGVDLVIDSLGGETGYRSLDALRHYGRLVNIGEAEGWPVENLRDKLYERSTSFAGFETIHAMQDPAAWRKGVEYITAAFAEGKLDLPIAAVFPLEKCREMHEKMESRTVSGKLLLKM